MQSNIQNGIRQIREAVANKILSGNAYFYVRFKDSEDHCIVFDEYAIDNGCVDGDAITVAKSLRIGDIESIDFWSGCDGCTFK